MQQVQPIQLNTETLMEKLVNSSFLRKRLSDILDEVQFNREKYIIERKGKPAVALVPLSVYENWKRDRERLFELIAKAQNNSGEQDPDEIMALVLEAQEATRAEND